MLLPLSRRERRGGSAARGINVGDRVGFNHHSRPHYLRGVEGTVIELDQYTATCPYTNRSAGPARRDPPLPTPAARPPAPAAQLTETVMSPTHATAELDGLIEEIRVGCCDEFEQLTAFQTASGDDATFPRPDTFVAQQVDVLSAHDEQPSRDECHLPTQRKTGTRLRCSTST